MTHAGKGGGRGRGTEKSKILIQNEMCDVSQGTNLNVLRFQTMAALTETNTPVTSTLVRSGFRFSNPEQLRIKLFSPLFPSPLLLLFLAASTNSNKNNLQP